MSKYLFVLICSLFIHFAAFAQGVGDLEANSGANFEAELQLLEKQELETENNQMKAVEEISTTKADDTVEDSISNAQASPTRVPIEINPETTMKTRRIRSR